MQPTRPRTSAGDGSEGVPPPGGRYYNNGQGRSSFAHHLPPPIPSLSSPRNGQFYPSSPGFRDGHSLGHTDPAAWASERPVSNRSSNRWSPTLPGLALSPRHPSYEGGPMPRGLGLPQHQLGNPPSGQPQQHRLPPLSDYPQRPTSGWGDPPSTGHSSITSRPPTSYDTFRPSSSQRRSQHPSQHDPNAPQTFQPLLRESGRDRRESDAQPYTPMEGSPEQSAIREMPDSPGGGETGKKKKRRVALSCAECAKRKQKCNRETPCQHCVSRRVPELCVPYARNTSPVTRGAAAGEKKETGKDIKQERAGSSMQAANAQEEQTQSAVTSTQPMVPSASSSKPASVLPTLSVRVMRLEAMVNTMINQVSGLEGKALQDWRINHAPVLSSTGLVQRQQETSMTSSPRTRPDTGEDIAIDREASAGPEMGLTGIDAESSTRNPLPLSMLESSQSMSLGLDDQHPAHHLQGIFNDSGISPHKIQDLMSELPPRADANDLIEWFFTKVNYVRYPISEHLFRQSFAMLYDSRSITGPAVLALPLVFIVLAMAIRVAPDQWVGGEDDKRNSSLRMYWNSRAAINMASAVKAETMQLVETRICTGLYLVLMHERRLAEGWAEFRAGLTTGHAIGLHRDGAKLSLDGYTTEYRRRLWSYLVHADATYSCLLGRPISIDLRTCDTLPPSNLNMDLYQSSETPPMPKPLYEPTFATYLIFRRKLGEIVSRITKHFQRLDGVGAYKDVQVLDGEIKALRNELPVFFAMEKPDTSWDERCWYLPVHRYYIQTEILHFTIILHRPWLLRRLKSDRYQLSRQACFEAAVTDYKIRQAWKRDHPEFFETLLGSSFRAFNAAMIAGISMIVDPRGPHASDMEHIVQSFMQEHPHNPRADDFSQKEAAIIYTLHRRAIEMDDKRVQSQSLARGNISNERGQKAGNSPHSSRIDQVPNGTIGYSNGSTSTIAAPGLPHRTSGDSAGSRASDATPHQNPLAYYTGGQIASGVDMTPASSISEEDGPQKLLDQWLMANTTFGPGADATINPFISTYTGLPPMYQYNMASSISNQSQLISNQSQLIQSISNQYEALQPSISGPSPTPASVQGPLASGLEIDPTLRDASQTMFGLGIDPTGTESNVEMGEASDRVQSLVGPLGQDGNPTVFWDRLIDGIVVGQGYDLMGAPSV